MHTWILDHFELVVLASACLVFWRLSTVAFGGISAVTLCLCPSRCTWWVRLGRPSSCASLWLLLEEFPVPCARAVRTWNLVHYFRVHVAGSHCSGCLGVADEYENWNFWEMTFFLGAILGSTVDTCSASVLWLLRTSSWEQCLVLQTYFTLFLRCGRLKS